MQLTLEQENSSAARYVLTHPEEFHDQPTILAGAWSTLMAQRGKTVNLHRLGEPTHLIVHSGHKQPDRISTKIIEMADRKGYFRPPAGGMPA
jgi:phosphoribosylcarboxyaminoimidazole (NCAIR) mutase